MIEYLEKLVEDKEYQKALDYAEQLLLNPENKAWDLMAIYTLLCKARLATGEFYGGQVAGQLAMKMAEELEAWDHFGEAAFYLGFCHARLRQEDSLSTWYEYLAHVPYYGKSKRHHASVLANIGIMQLSLKRLDEALRTLHQAAEVTAAEKNERVAHGVRQILINAYLQSGQYREIPPLLAKSAHYLRSNPDVVARKQSFLWHCFLRARYAVATNRLHRAALVAKRGIRLADSPEWCAEVSSLRLLLADVYERQGKPWLALRQGIQARSVAIEAHRFDVEFQSMEYIYGLLSTHPSLSERLDGVDDESGSGLQ